MKFGSKLFLFMVFSVLIHYAGDIIGNRYTFAFLPTHESIFQHTKIVFYAYIFTNLIDWNFFKKNIYKVFLVAITMAYPMMLIYYSPFSIIGTFDHLWSEFVWAIIATLLTGIATLAIEKGIEVQSKLLKIISVVLFCVMVFLLARFTYVVPWLDYFQIPITNYK